MQNRPLQFRINPNAQLGKGLVFAGLGRHTGSTRFHDSSLFGNHGVLTNMDPPTDWVWVPELGRWALDFDGSDDYILCNRAIQYADPNILSISAWVSAAPTGTSQRLTILGCQNEASVVQLEINTDQNVGVTRNIAAIIDGTYIATTRPGWKVGWHHVVYTRSGAGSGKNAIYLDGVAQSLYESSATNFIQGSTATEIGRRSTTVQKFLGRMADILVYDQALSSSEISRLADPSNVMLGGLILPPRRRIFPAAAVEEESSSSSSQSLSSESTPSSASSLSSISGQSSASSPSSVSTSSSSESTPSSASSLSSISSGSTTSVSSPSSPSSVSTPSSVSGESSISSLSSSSIKSSSTSSVSTASTASSPSSLSSSSSFSFSSSSSSSSSSLSSSSSSFSSSSSSSSSSILEAIGALTGMVTVGTILVGHIRSRLALGGKVNLRQQLSGVLSVAP